MEPGRGAVVGRGGGLLHAGTGGAVQMTTVTLDVQTPQTLWSSPKKIYINK